MSMEFKPVVDGMFKPVVDGMCKPAVEGMFKPAVEGMFKPAVKGMFKPAVEGMFKPSFSAGCSSSIFSSSDHCKIVGPPRIVYFSASSQNINFGAKRVAVRAPDTLLLRSCTEFRSGSNGTTPGPQNSQKNNHSCDVAYSCQESVRTTNPQSKRKMAHRPIASD